MYLKYMKDDNIHKQRSTKNKLTVSSGHKKEKVGHKNHETFVNKLNIYFVALQTKRLTGWTDGQLNSRCFASQL